jgi:hypothetical protein
MGRLNLLRQFLPDRETYACQGYGHREIWPYDDTHKEGTVDNLYQFAIHKVAFPVEDLDGNLESPHDCKLQIANCKLRQFNEC